MHPGRPEGLRLARLAARLGVRRVLMLAAALAALAATAVSWRAARRARAAQPQS